MFSRFFIYRPIFAGVISIVILIAGSLSLPLLPIEQTPDITPPTVVVSTSYPGANARVIAETVADPIEKEVNGVEGSIYTSSKSTDDGTYELTVTFEIGTDVDMANVLVQNRVSIAEPRLPEEVKREGIKTEKRSTNMVLMINLYSPSGEYDELYISNYLSLYLKDDLSRINGVGKVDIMGAKDYSMRVWLDPNKLKSRGLTTNDVTDAIREQNVQVAAGQIGAAPSPPGQEFQYTVTTLGRLSDADQFNKIVVKVGEDGELVYLSDVARVELDAQSYNWSVDLNSAPSIAAAIYQLPGANALDIAEKVKALMEAKQRDFPEGLEYKIAYDTTKFVEASIEEVVVTLFVAVVLVIFTVYIFLQDFRTTLIPSATIPVALIGTLAVMLGLGMSINTLSLFGLVLAIGIVVDDAIVVVENTMRIIDEEGLSAKEATAKAMEEVTGPVVATTCVLLAVFVPTAMMSGITGQLYSQFAMTIATATVFSSINALTLSPALCGVLLRPSPKKRGWFFTGFNRLFDVSTKSYMGLVSVGIRRIAVSMLLLGGLYFLTGWSFMNVPTGFIPDEDQGYFMINMKLPDGATLERTEKVLAKVDKILDEVNSSYGEGKEPIADRITVVGYSALDSLVTPNAGTYFVVLKNWDQRPDPDQHVAVLTQKVQARLGEVQEAIGIAFMPPPITGLGNAGGFEYRLQAQKGVGVEVLEDYANDLVAEGNYKNPVVTRLNNNFSANVPQIHLEVDRTKVKTAGIPLQSVFSTLQAYLGSAYVNDFTKFGSSYKVMIQADGKFRSQAEDISKLDVRNSRGEMVPLSTLLSVSDTAGPQTIYRYNMLSSATITGQPSPGYSSGQAIQAMEKLSAQNLPSDMTYSWSGVTFQQIAAGSQAPIIFSLAIVFVYLFLAAQYESWSTPMSVLFSVPLAIFGAMIITFARSYDNNIYTQIGLVLLIGLAAKSAILIVEFAKQRREEGLSIVEAATEAARLRFRAILMTAFSFILGVIPLAIATGAGSASRRALGTAVFGGMLAATVFGVFVIPVLYVLVQRVSESLTGAPKMVEESPSVSDSGPSEDNKG